MKNYLKNFMTDDEQKILIFIVIFAVLGLALKFIGIEQENDLLSADSLVFEKDYEIKYDLKSATKEELITIPGIGDKKSEDIISYRENSGFESKEDLMKVKGIGKKTYQKIESYFYDFGSVSNPAEKVKSQKDETVIEDKKIPEFQKVNINTADLEEFTILKGIGPKKAELIIEYRKEIGEFTDINQLLEVKGIGEKTLEKIKDMITLGIEK